MTQVVFRKGTWTYGYWGGDSSWSQGEFLPTDQLADQKFGVKDALDQQFKDHDTKLADGTEVFGLADVQRADGSIVQAADAAFRYNAQRYHTRTRTDASGNTVFELESRGLRNALEKVAIRAMNTGAGGQFYQLPRMAANDGLFQLLA